MSVCAERGLAVEAEVLAHRIAGASPSPAILTLARAVADAQIDLIRIRQTARDWLGRDVATQSCPSVRRNTEIPFEQEGSKDHERNPGYLGDVSTELARHIEILTQYERRALSRRNRAIQDLDCQRVIEAVGAKKS